MDQEKQVLVSNSYHDTELTCEDTKPRRESIMHPRISKHISYRNLICLCGFLFLMVYWVSLLQSHFGLCSGSQVETMHHNLSNIGNIKWWKTDDSDIENGNIIVPLDYHNLTKGGYSLGLTRLRSKSSKKDRKGTVLLNAGGPGGDTSHWSPAGLRGLAVARVGPDFDIVGFSPRGIGRSYPPVKCFPDHELFKSLISNTVLQNGPDLLPNHLLFSDSQRESLDRDFRQMISIRETMGKMCAQNMDPSILKYMGSTFVARDAAYVTDKLDGEGALINYWAVSYGSILGAYIMNMFPNRIGRFNVDGIVNVVDWAMKPSAFWYPSWLSGTDDAYNRFLDACVEAGLKACPLIKETSDTAVTLADRIDDFLDELYYHPLPVAGERSAGLFTSGGMRSLILIALEVPQQWPVFADYLSLAIDSRNATYLHYILAAFSAGGDMERTAVTCADSPPYSSTNSSLWPTPEQFTDQALHALRTYSQRWGLTTLSSEPDGGCEFWPTNKIEDMEWEKVERFDGPWNATFNNPVLISNTLADPITPLASALKLHELHKTSSGLLLQDAAGHTTVMTPSLCTARHSLAYFATGVLPPANTTCSVDINTFGKWVGKGDGPSKEEKEILDGTLEIIGWEMGKIFV